MITITFIKIFNFRTSNIHVDYSDSESDFESDSDPDSDPDLDSDLDLDLEFDFDNDTFEYEWLCSSGKKYSCSSLSCK